MGLLLEMRHRIAELFYFPPEIDLVRAPLLKPLEQRGFPPSQMVNLRLLVINSCRAVLHRLH